MKTKNLKFIAMILLVVVSFVSCEKKGYKQKEKEYSLKGTRWKLVGIVDETATLQELEPKDCEECYTLTFDTDTTFFMYSSVNELVGGYTADYIQNNFQINYFGGIKIAEIGDGNLFVNPFWNKAIKRFFLKSNKLKMYYNENKNYLFFEQ